MTIYEEIEREVRAALHNDVCTAQALDVAADRGRVLREVMKAITKVKMRHANLHNALGSTLDAHQVSKVSH